jgi:hypothetical protein
VSRDIRISCQLVDLLRICLAPSATTAAPPCQWPYVDAVPAGGAMPFLSLVVKTQVGAHSNFYFKAFSFKRAIVIRSALAGKGAEARFALLCQCSLPTSSLRVLRSSLYCRLSSDLHSFRFCTSCAHVSWFFCVTWPQEALKLHLPRRMYEGKPHELPVGGMSTSPLHFRAFSARFCCAFFTHTHTHTNDSHI